MDEAAGRISQLTSPGSPYPSHPPAEARQSRGLGRRARVRRFRSVLVILALVGAAETPGIWKPLGGFGNDYGPYNSLTRQREGQSPGAYAR